MPDWPKTLLRLKIDFMRLHRHLYAYFRFQKSDYSHRMYLNTHLRLPHYQPITASVRLTKYSNVSKKIYKSIKLSTCDFWMISMPLFCSQFVVFEMLFILIKLLLFSCSIFNRFKCWEIIFHHSCNVWSGIVPFKIKSRRRNSLKDSCWIGYRLAISLFAEYCIVLEKVLFLT